MKRVDTNPTTTATPTTTTTLTKFAAMLAASATLIAASSAFAAAGPGPIPASASAAAVQSAPTAFADTVIASGNKWVKKTSKTRGAWEIVRRDDGSRVVRLKGDFKTRKAPDLKIVLSPHTSKTAKNKNALEGGKVISLLKNHKGAQEFVIPASVDLSKYKSVLIHCEQYTKLWAVADITPPTG
ncbi:MAG: DM13 domain-containing protein [Planctomycetota bacterium]